MVRAGLHQVNEPRARVPVAQCGLEYKTASPLRLELWERGARHAGISLRGNVQHGPALGGARGGGGDGGSN
jgi:hypothetical protein